MSRTTWWAVTQIALVGAFSVAVIYGHLWTALAPLAVFGCRKMPLW